MIDVIIPAYNAHDVIEKALCSIAYQDISDKLNVIIVDDCSKEGYSSFVDYYSEFFSIREIRMKKNGGPGAARQYGIDNSTNPYIIFLDSDDLFADCFSARRLYEAMETGKYDVVIGTIVIENGNGSFEFFDDSKVWLHGKMYRRGYLTDNNIRFNDTRLDEDNYFNNLVFLSGARELILGKKTSVWKYNNNSLTRLEGGDYKNNPLIGFALNISMVLEELDRRKADPSKIASLSFPSLLYIYYSYLINRNIDMIFQCRDNIVKMIELNDKYIPYCSDEEIDSTFKAQFDFSSNPNYHTQILDADITYRDFLDLVKRGNIND